MKDGSSQCSHFITLALLSDTRIASKYHQSLLMSLNLKRKIVPQCVAWRQLLASVQLLCAGSGNEEAMEWKGCGLFNQCKHCFKEKDLVTEQQVTRGEITAQSINKHTITVVAVLESSWDHGCFWDRPLQGTGREHWTSSKETGAVLLGHSSP